MSDYLKAACEHVGATPEQVLAHRVDSAEQVFVLVVDNGIKGAPKHEIPLSELIAVSEPVIIPEPPKNAPEGDFETADVGYSDMTVAELQEIAKERGIGYSGLRKAELIEVLS